MTGVRDLLRAAYRMYRSDSTVETYLAVVLVLIGVGWVYWQTSHKRR